MFKIRGISSHSDQRFELRNAYKEYQSNSTDTSYIYSIINEK